MREKLQTLPLLQLRELAKSQGIKNITVMRKADLIDKLCEVAEQMEKQKAEKEKPTGRSLRKSGRNGSSANARSGSSGTGNGPPHMSAPTGP